jgi:uncharacterized protein
MATGSEPQSQRSYGWLIFILVAIVGLFYVKWFPYYHRAFTAETTHSIGKSILMGRAASPPAPSVAAALDYAWAYGCALVSPVNRRRSGQGPRRITSRTGSGASVG